MTEYRCQCGKLLFKGLLLQCVIEVKCRRCGAFSSWQQASSADSVLIKSDAGGRVIDASGLAFDCSRYDRTYVRGKRLEDVMPLVRDCLAKSSPTAPDVYAIPGGILFLREGEETTADSYVIPRFEGGSLVGHNIFSVLKPAVNTMVQQAPVNAV